MSGPRVTSTDISVALRARYPAPEWAVAFEVSETTGGGRRRADCVAMNCYPSRGLEIVGVEIKISRADWLRELKAPAKAEEGVYRYCDRWLIAAPPGVVLSGELPPTWGLLTLTGGKLTEATKAPKLTALPLSRGFVASLFRSLGVPGEAELRMLIYKETDKIRSESEQLRTAERIRANEEIKVRDQQLRMIETATGLRAQWASEAEAAELGAFIKAARTLGLVGRTRLLAEMEGQAQSILEQIRSAQHVAASSLNEIHP